MISKLADQSCLAKSAIDALSQANLDKKVAKVNALATAWEDRVLSLVSHKNLEIPSRPGRPQNPSLLPAHKVPKRSLRSEKGRIALLHAIAHIELNAIDLALDIIARFASVGMPRSFFDGWVMVAKEEAKHFGLLCERLSDFAVSYGDLPAHDGLWEASQRTQRDLAARLAIVPLVLEARGLDITPSLIEQVVELKDHKTAEIFKIIFEDEKGHVAVGAKWFRFLCQKNGIDPANEFQRLVRKHFRGPLKPPFNDLARSRSGITPLFYRNLSSAGH